MLLGVVRDWQRLELSLPVPLVVRWQLDERRRCCPWSSPRDRVAGEVGDVGGGRKERGESLVFASSPVWAGWYTCFPTSRDYQPLGMVARAILSSGFPALLLLASCVCWRWCLGEGEETETCGPRLQAF